MRHLWLVVAVAGSGCNSLLGIDELTLAIDAPGTIADAAIDASIDAAIDAPGEECFGTLAGPMTVCWVRVTTPALTLPAGTINTMTDNRCRNVTMANNVVACILAGESVSITGNLVVTGPNPLIIASATSLSVGGDIELGSSLIPPRVGAGANPTNVLLCPVAGPGGPSGGNSGGGGGAGAAFGGPGAVGGLGGGIGGGVGGVPVTGLLGTGLRGGCRGGIGGGDTQDNGPGGNGGGAIYLLAGQSITISRKIHASGGGGSGGTGDGAGGGGGGTGGMIAFEAPTVTFNGGTELDANGGGGGGGSTEGSQTDGGPGGHSTAYNSLGASGTKTGEGGAGGTGATQTAAPSPGAVGTVSGGGNPSEGGGGGGGGGLGLIWVKSPTLTGDLSKISPTITQAL